MVCVEHLFISNAYIYFFLSNSASKSSAFISGIELDLTRRPNRLIETVSKGYIYFMHFFI